MKTAIPKPLNEMKECTACHSFTAYGFELRDSNASRFVCEECFGRLRGEYSICRKMLEINTSVLSRIAPDAKPPSFQAGYLFGHRADIGGVERIVVTHHLNCLQPNRGTVSFFSYDDAVKIRRFCRENSCTVVAVYRTNPSGLPVFNSLDEKTAADMSNMPYVIIAGTTEMQIAIRDKHYPDYEYGVIVV